METEGRDRELFDPLPIPVIISRGSDTAILYANPRLLALLHASGLAEVFGHDIAAWLHPDWHEKAARNVAAIVAGEKAIDDTRYRLLRKDGSCVDVDVYAIPTEFEGEPAMFSFLLDASAVQQAEASQLAAEGRYRTLVETWPDAIFVHRDGRFLFANPAAAPMFGARDPSDLVGRRIVDLVSPDSQAEMTERLRIVYQGRTSPPPSIATGRRLDGTEFAVEVRTTPITYEGEPAAQAFVRDLSYLESAERAAQRAASRAQAIVASMPLGLHSYRLEDDGRLLLTNANPAADQITGIDHSSLIGLTLEDAFPELVGTEVPEAYRNVARTGVSWESQSLHYHEEGRPDASFDVHVFRTEPNAITVAFDDITERKRAEVELAESRERLERAVEERTAELTESNRALQEATNAKSAFLASISHELRTPLNSIIGFSGILLQGITGQLTPEQQRQVTMINRSGRQLLSLVGDVLDLEKVEAGRVELMVDEFEVPRFVGALVDTVRPMASEKGLELNVDFSGAPGRMVGDRERLEQVLLNLLSNAIRYTETGSVSLTVTGRPDSSVAFSVKDTGVGIPEEERDRVFEEFHQLLTRGVAKNAGTGLGLSIARHLAALMGGTIELHSEVGVGSVFTLVVPGT